MLDPLVITSIVLSFSACLASLLTHVRTSKCFGDCFSMETRTPPGQSPNRVVATTPNPNTEKTFLIK